MPTTELLDKQTLQFVADEIQKEVEAGSLKLYQGCEFTLESAGDARRSELIEKLEKYIDFDAGGLKLLEVPLRGNPAKFLLVPDISKKGLGITLRFEYRF